MWKVSQASSHLSSDPNPSLPPPSHVRFYNCVNGVAYELPCATGLVFDEAQGTCVREEQASEYAKKCEKKKEKEQIEGFSCPDHETLGPHGQVAHAISSVLHPCSHVTFSFPALLISGSCAS